MTSRKKFQREIWKALNAKGRTHRKNLPWYIPKVPSILSMLFRCFTLMMFTAGIWSIEIISILGEDVFWKFNFVDNLIIRQGTNLGDIFIFVSVVTYGLIWGIGMFWVVGMFDRWFS